MPNHYTHIYYKDCPHFTVGTVDQWGEQGYLFYEGKIYSYMEDRKEQYNTVDNPRTIDEFFAYASHWKIQVPQTFLDLIGEN